MKKFLVLGMFLMMAGCPIYAGDEPVLVPPPERAAAIAYRLENSIIYLELVGVDSNGTQISSETITLEIQGKTQDRSHEPIWTDEQKARLTEIAKELAQISGRIQ